MYSVCNCHERHLTRHSCAKLFLLNLKCELVAFSMSETARLLIHSEEKLCVVNQSNWHILAY